MVKDNGHKAKRVRSPAYPACDLKTAILHAQAIYDAEKRNAAPVGVVAAHCGHDISSSVGMRLIAALKQFGLLSEHGSGDDREVKLTERALDVLLAPSEDSPDRRKSIAASALAPKIHKKLWDHFAGDLPSDQNLRAFLLRQLEFNDATVNRFIKQFRATIAFANLRENDTISGSPKSLDTRRQKLPPITWTITPQDDPETPVPKMIELPVTLPSLQIAVVRVPSQMTPTDFKVLEDSLQAWKSALVKVDNPETIDIDIDEDEDDENK